MLLAYTLMGYARLAMYIVGLILVVTAAWIFLTQTPIADDIPGGLALALILLLVGIGVMAGARAMDDTFVHRRRVVHDGGADYVHGPVAPGTTYVAPAQSEVTTTRTNYGTPPPAAGPSETFVEERRY